MRRIRRHVPLPLACLMLAGTILTCAWAVAQPPFQGPDEEKHVAYVQRIVEQREIPWYVFGNCPDCEQALSTEVREARIVSGMAALQGNPAMKDTRTRPDERAWNAVEDRLPGGARADGVYQDTMRNGPAYYLWAGVPYVATRWADVFDRVTAMRLANLPFLLALIAAAWVLAGAVVGPRPWLQALAAGVVALNAQLLSIAGSVNADMLLAAVFGVALALMAVVLTRGPTRPRLAALAGLAVLAPLTHPRGLPLAVPVLATLAIVWWRGRAPRDARAVRRMRLAVGAVAAVALAAVLVVATRGQPTPANVRELGSYLWQFYLPKLGFMTPSPRADWGWREVFVDRFWGIFTQFDVIVAPWVMDVMAAATLVGLAALVAVLVARRATLRRAGALAAVLALAFLAYLGALHVGAWRNLSAGSDDPMLTGRYFLPFVVLLGLACALLVSWLPRRAAAPAAAGILAAAFALHLAALGALVTRFHA